MPPNYKGLTRSEAAARLGVSVTTVGALEDKGLLTSERQGRRVFVTQASVDAEAARRHLPTAQSQMNRRNLLTALGVAIVGGGIGGGPSGWIFVLWDKLDKFREDRVNVEDLFPTWADVQVVPGGHHPKEGYHPDTRAALEKLAPLVPRSHPVEAFGADSLPAADLARDLLLIGGPIANLASRDLHGYTFANNKISVRPARNTGLRWSFYYPERAENDPSFSRFVRGELIPTMPKALVDGHASGALAQPLHCKYDETDGRISSDYLLVTVLPNTLGATSTGFSIIDVADLQGQGNKTFADIVKDGNARSELAKMVDHKRYFQALYEVPVFHVGNETKPGTPILLDAYALT